MGFLASVGKRLAASRNPLAVLRAALPDIVALAGARTGHLLRLDPASAPNSSGIRDGLVHSIVPLCAEAVGIEDSSGLGIALAHEPDAAGSLEANHDFLDALVRIAGLVLVKEDLRRRLAGQGTVGRELEMAAEVQESLQPNCPPGRLPIWGVNRPARKVSGDFFDFYSLDDNRIAFALGDVSGKGINAALLMAKTISLFRCLSKRIANPAALLEAMNDELCETQARGMFVTMVAGLYCMGSGQICFANAGHEPPLLRRLDRGYETFPAQAPPLGILPGTSFTDEQATLDGGEFFVFTDGLPEYRYADGEMLGVDGLIQLVEATAHEPLAQRLEGLLDRLNQEIGWEARDDLTLLAIDDSWVREDAGIDEPQQQFAQEVQR